MTAKKPETAEAETKMKEDITEEADRENTEDAAAGDVSEAEERSADSENEADGSGQQEASEESKGEAEAVSVEIEELNRKYLRLAADFQNFRKRADKERGDTLAFANEKIVKDLLEVMDNFERALEQETPGAENFKEGMKLIFDQFKAALAKHGLEEIAALGKMFDPNFHHAVLAEDTEEYESGHVSGVMQKGYTLKGKVVRPSMVKVAN